MLVDELKHAIQNQEPTILMPFSNVQQQSQEGPQQKLFPQLSHVIQKQQAIFSELGMQSLGSQEGALEKEPEHVIRDLHTPSRNFQQRSQERTEQALFDSRRGFLQDFERSWEQYWDLAACNARQTNVLMDDILSFASECQWQKYQGQPLPDEAAEKQELLARMRAHVQLLAETERVRARQQTDILGVFRSAEALYEELVAFRSRNDERFRQVIAAGEELAGREKNCARREKDLNERQTRLGQRFRIFEIVDRVDELCRSSVTGQDDGEETPERGAGEQLGDGDHGSQQPGEQAGEQSEKQENKKPAQRPQGKRVKSDKGGDWQEHPQVGTPGVQKEGGIEHYWQRKYVKLVALFFLVVGILLGILTVYDDGCCCV